MFNFPQVTVLINFWRKTVWVQIHWLALLPCSIDMGTNHLKPPGLQEKFLSNKKKEDEITKMHTLFYMPKV